jgi:hypothetical protein
MREKLGVGVKLKDEAADWKRKEAGGRCRRQAETFKAAKS